MSSFTFHPISFFYWRTKESIFPLYIIVCCFFSSEIKISIPILCSRSTQRILSLQHYCDNSSFFPFFFRLYLFLLLVIHFWTIVILIVTTITLLECELSTYTKIVERERGEMDPYEKSFGESLLFKFYAKQITHQLWVNRCCCKHDSQ